MDCCIRFGGADSYSASCSLQAAALLEEDPVPPAMAESSAGVSIGGADVLQIEDSGDALDIDLDDPFQAQMLDISQPIVADEHMLKCLKQQVHRPCCPLLAGFADHGSWSIALPHAYSTTAVLYSSHG